VSEVLVVTGVGGMGLAIARRMGPSRKVVLADVSDAQLTDAAEHLVADGYDVHPLRTDVSSAGDVTELARVASGFGPVRCVAHTAGVSPVQATPQQIVDVDVMGTALVLDAFEPHVQPGTVAVCIASMAGAAELAGPSGDFMRDMIKSSGTGRIGTPDDIAAAVEFLASPAASFITGTDVLVDGGAIAALVAS
jgi:NAD(P)-dependent dehydrogenase (short-subunit alcohol dehydrogenase family)